MASIGPWRPEAETFQQYIQRVIDNAGRPTPEQYDQLAALLRLGDTGD